ncbi:MAG: 2-amino-4-hydroxy-6-hydroxymethyldihydropteridine diphosphokinase [Verrucomicrobia bacterium]|nr:MAG: 2-amino-4-hydroxy-6-hydroxymethyldihydropteridine diphosphokinase [Verrucomicrobiota bacterium]
MPLVDFRAGIALGSNLGDSLSHLRWAARALKDLSASPQSVRASHIYRTEPIDCPPNSAFFLNAVVEIEWKKGALALWEELQKLEIHAGRQQQPRPLHTPRPLDLDFLYLNSVVLTAGPIRLPHPRIQNRRFVLAPLADCATDRVLPNQKLTVQQLLAALPLSPTVQKIEDPLFT